MSAASQSLIVFGINVEFLQRPGTPNKQFKMDVWWFPTISNVKVGNHPIETTTYKWLFGVPGLYDDDITIYTWIFQVCKFSAFSPKNPTKKAYN